MDFLISPAFAQAAGPQPSPWSPLIMLAIFFAVFIAIDIAFTRQKTVLSARTTSHGSGAERTDAPVAKVGGVSMSD